jgi:hypothetical protein
MLNNLVTLVRTPFDLELSDQQGIVGGVRNLRQGRDVQSRRATLPNQILTGRPPRRARETAQVRFLTLHSHCEMLKYYSPLNHTPARIQSEQAQPRRIRL